MVQPVIRFSAELKVASFGEVEILKQGDIHGSYAGRASVERSRRASVGIRRGPRKGGRVEVGIETILNASCRGGVSDQVGAL